MSFKLRIWQSSRKVTITGLPELVAKEVEKLSNQGFTVLSEGRYDATRVFVDMVKDESTEEK